MIRFYSLPLLGIMLASSAFAQERGEHRWENVEHLKPGRKIEVTTTHLRTIQGTYLSSSEAAIRLQTPQGEVTVMREEVFRVKSQEGKRKQNILVGVVIGALSGVVLGAVADFKDDVDGSDPGSNNGKLGGSVVGAGIGAGIGSLFAGHRVIYRAKALPSPQIGRGETDYIEEASFLRKTPAPSADAGFPPRLTIRRDDVRSRE